MRLCDSHPSFQETWASFRSLIGPEIKCRDMQVACDPPRLLPLSMPRPLRSDLNNAYFPTLPQHSLLLHLSLALFCLGMACGTRYGRGDITRHMDFPEFPTWPSAVGSGLVLSVYSAFLSEENHRILWKGRETKLMTASYWIDLNFLICYVFGGTWWITGSGPQHWRVSTFNLVEKNGTFRQENSDSKWVQNLVISVRLDNSTKQFQVSLLSATMLLLNRTRLIHQLAVFLLTLVYLTSGTPLEKRATQVSLISYTYSNNILSGSINVCFSPPSPQFWPASQIQNIAYSKVVNVVYAVGNSWTSSQVITASYSASGSNGYETWTFSGGAQGATQFYIRYDVSGSSWVIPIDIS